jgi:radical SAM-linked protein
VSALKIRIRFSKEGPMKFVGHLDMVRYFQKVIRRAEVDIAYSEGFSPHQKMSFAAPLSVGITSVGEYFDIEVHSTQSTDEMVDRLNRHNVEGIKIMSYKLLPDNAKNAMALLSAADYCVHTDLFTQKNISDFYNQNTINILKKTKRSEKEINIKEMIYDIYRTDKGIFMKVAQGSVANLKPDLVMSAMSDFCGISLPEFVQYQRLDMYCLNNGHFISLDSLGENVE